LALKTGLCQSDRPGDSGSSDDANSAAGRCRRVTLRSGPRHHWPITRSWGVVRFPPRVRSRDARGARARGRCNRIPYALRLRWHGSCQRSITSPFQAASTRFGGYSAHEQADVIRQLTAMKRRPGAPKATPAMAVVSVEPTRVEGRRPARRGVSRSGSSNCGRAGYRRGLVRTLVGREWR